MGKTKSYKVNYTDKIILITKEFERLAGIVGNDEYKVLRQLIQDYPDFEIQHNTQKSTGTRHSGLTFTTMRNFIKEQDDGDTVIKEFEKKFKEHEGSKGRYAIVKSWYLEKYPQFTALHKRIETEKKKLAGRKTQLLAEVELAKSRAENERLVFTMSYLNTTGDTEDVE